MPGARATSSSSRRWSPAGIGALLAQLEARKKALEAEGLFAAARKKPLPYLPEVIGIVTSPTGAVIRDMLHRLADRFPRRVLLWPVAVQGASAAEQVAKAIAGFNAIKPGGAVPRPDLLIVARGGGSIEDLWAFNEEIVVRAAAASRIPLISAVGHETDTTLIDYASDFRAPTPSAAAERAVPVRDELRLAAGEYGQRLHARINERLARHREQVGLMGRALPRPQQLVAGMSQRLDEVAARLAESFPRGLEQRLHRLNALRLSPRSLMLQWQHAMEKLNGLSALLESLNVASVLKRGFAIVHDGSGRLVTSTAGVPAGGALALTFADGEKRVRIATEKPKAPSAQQSSLFEES
ncbi:MAG: exodeoxyribonuclease VII large subunit [Alphaproteobacteria bacterium]